MRADPFVRSAVVDVIPRPPPAFPERACLLSDRAQDSDQSVRLSARQFERMAVQVGFFGSVLTGHSLQIVRGQQPQRLGEAGELA